MLSEKPWRTDAVLRLCGALLVSVALGALVSAALRRYFSTAGADTLNFCHFIISNISFHGAALWLVSIFLREHQVDWRAAFGFTGARWPRTIGLAAAAVLVTLPASWALNLTSAWVMTQFHLEPIAQQAVQTLQTTESPKDRIYFGVIAILVAPAVEELLFRGILYPLVKQRGHPHLALWGTACLFAATHNNLMTFVPLTFLALVLTWLYEKTDNLTTPIAAHALFNTANYVWLLNADSISRLIERICRAG
ncbi:MAG: CPBP family intramembrane metalloprotease [Verrucomicrobia bacterium]|nr:CPBP family intramembrane metalloprotease [Verrucomicrobiota bacterium]